MTIIPITLNDPVCMGVCCQKHSHCERYQRVDGSSPDDHRIIDCGPEHVMYVPVRIALVDLAAQAGVA